MLNTKVYIVSVRIIDDITIFSLFVTAAREKRRRRWSIQPCNLYKPVFAVAWAPGGPNTRLPKTQGCQKTPKTK
jgi:hypothetical protein